MSEKKGFFSRLKDGLTKTRDNFVAELTIYSTAFRRLTMISMKSLKKCLLWQILV